MDHMELCDYLKSKNISQKDFAAEVGVTGTILSQYLTGKFRPNLRIAVKIEELTNGIVRPKDMLLSFEKQNKYKNKIG